MNEKIGSIANYLAALLTLAFGMIYLLKNSFMPYHSEALSLEWKEVESNTQYLILALMRAVSGGFVAASLVVVVLQRKFILTKISWIPWLIFATGLIVSFASIYATMIVRLNSPGKPPTVMAIGGIVLLIIGFIFNQKALKRN